jgi:hypothetical protein
VRREVEGAAPANVPLMLMAPRRPDRSRAAPLLGGALATVAAGSLVVFSLLAQRAGLEAYRGPGVRATSLPSAASPVVVPGIQGGAGDSPTEPTLQPDPDSDVVLADVEERAEVPADESDRSARPEGDGDNDKPRDGGPDEPEPSPTPEPSFTPPRGSGGHLGSEHGGGNGNGYGHENGHGKGSGNGPRQPKDKDQPAKGPKRIPPGHAKAKGKGHHKHDHDHFGKR